MVYNRARLELLKNNLLTKYEVLLRQKQKELFKAQTEIDLIYQMIDDVKYLIMKEEAEAKND